MKRGCIHTEICANCADDGHPAGESVLNGTETWFPYAGLVNCTECWHKYGSPDCKEYRRPLGGSEEPYAKVILT